MRCPTCGGENVEGAKFCGVCGQRLIEGPPTVPPGAQRVTGETRSLPPQRRPAPPPAGASLGESLRVPEAGGARMAKIGIVLAIDAALAIAGIVLLTRGGGEGASAPGGGQAVVMADGAIVAVERTDGGSGPATGGGGGPGTAVRPPGGGTGTGPGPGTGRDPGSVLPGGVIVDAAPGGGSGTGGTGPVTDAPTGVTPAPIDAPPAVEPAPIDAPAAEPAPIDAPAVEPPPIDAPAGDPGVDGPEAAASAGDLARHLARLVVQSAGRMDRCYQNATKALPADQPLSGEVDIGLSVMPTGQVQNVTVVRNTTGSSDLASCMQAGVAAWIFPPHGESEPVEFVNPWRFGPRSP